MQTDERSSGRGRDSRDYRRIEEAIRYLEAHALEHPSLDAVAGHIGLSPWHFQRLFRRWAGVSPKRFLQFLTAEHAKSLLRESASVLDAAFAVGLSGPGRLHDLLIAVEGVTPGEFKERGSGIEIRYGIHPTPFGECLLALTDRGICDLWFIEGERDAAVQALRSEWRGARLREDEAASAAASERIFSGGPSEEGPIRLFLRGTNFQLKVWQALLRIPEGTVVSYSGLALALGRPRAVRAVAGAVGRNPVSLLIPCHRVLRNTGEIGGYRWGTVRKRAILAREAAAGYSD